MNDESGQHIDDFGTCFLVVCPRCAGAAQVMLPESNPPEARASCTSCGYARRTSASTASIGGPRDWYLGLPLWLQTPCCGETLWALNEEHLAFLEHYLLARLRRRTPNINTSVASRLPRWMTSAKHRAEVARGLARLRALHTAAHPSRGLLPITPSES
ncbi:hypothetical protein F8S13_00980 [Chloroflexia bacterium SDU3-3]|nr:hypothetical protein F8S13_00980 [Chloroflexia bacterium SDU3-3]